MSPTRSLSALAGCLIFALAALGASSASAEVNHATGNFYEVEVDYEHLSDPALTLTRTYNSKQALVSDLGPGWSMNYVTERLVVSRHPGTIVETYGPYTRVVQPTFTTEIYYQSKSYERTGRAVLQQPDGKTRNLTTDGSTWRMPGERQTQIDCVQPHSAQLNPGLGSAPAYGLVSVAHNVTACGAFVVRSADGTVKTYTQTGGAAGLVYLLTAVQLDGGWAATLTYNQAGQLASVTSSFGRALQFTYTAGKLTQLNGPGGYQVQYAYNPDGSLASATKPAGSGRQYTYQLGRYLTHIRDSAGGLRRQITYDASNRATRVERQGGVGAYTFAYNTDGSTTVTNPNGLAATYQFASIGGARRLMSVSNPGCGCPSTTSQYSYDDNGAIVSAGDFNGASTSYTRDEFGRELSRYDSEGQVTETAWAPILNRKTRVVQAGVETAFEYDTAGNVVTRTETSSAGIRTWTYTYNGPLLTAVSGPGTQYNETYTYNAQGDLTSIVNAKGHATQITSRDAQGRILSITASSGLIHQFTYDAAGRVLTQSSGGELTLFVYGSAGELLSVTRPDGHQVSFTHDGAKRVIGATDNRGASVTYTLDAMGNVTRQEVRDGGAALSLVVNQVFNSRGWMTATSGASGQTTQFGHDGVGRLRSATDPLNRTTSWTLDTIGRIQQIIHADSATATTYWHAGNDSSFYDPVGGTTEYQWNGFRELVGENSSDAGSQTLSRDASGLVSSVTDARGIPTQITRDTLGRPTTILRGSSHQTQLVWDTNVPGFLASHQDPSGLTEYQRDAHGRVTGKTQHVNDSPSTPSVFQLQYLYEGGRLRRVTYPSGLVVTYQRQSGRVVGVDVQEPGLLKPTLPFVTSLTYTGLGVPRSWNWLSGDSASRQFDANGRMTGNEFASYTHDAAGQITSITQNLIATTSVSGTASYYLVPLQWNVAYDVRGRVTGFNRTGHGVTYTYDGNSNRLTSSDVRRSDSDLDGEVSGGDTIRTVEQAYDIAAASNRLMGFSKSIATTEAGQPISSATLSVALQLDAAGSMVHDGLREYVYDEAARLSKVRAASDGESAIVTYLHNAEGQRVFRSEPVAEDVLPNEATLGAGFIEWLRQSFRWLFTPSGSSTSLGMAFVHADGELPQWALLGQYDNSTSAGEGRTEYIWLPLEDGSAIPIGFYRAGQFYSVHTDHLGTPRLAKDATNKVAWQWPYSAFGDNRPIGALAATSSPTAALTASPSLLAGTPAVKFDLRFPGQVYDSASQTSYNYFRSYRASLGRYTQADPIGLVGGINPYAYVGGNPLEFIDEDGLQANRASGNPRMAIPRPQSQSGGYSYGQFYPSIGSPRASYPAGSTGFSAANIGSLQGTHQILRPQPQACRLTDVINETLAGNRNFTSRHTLTADEALRAAEQFLGSNYREIGQSGSGVFRSADGLRQFRMDPGSLTGSHPPGVPHVHFETFAPSASRPSANNHVPFK